MSAARSKSKLLLFCSDRLRFSETWGTEPTEDNTCWDGFSLRFSPSPRVCLWWWDCRADASLLLAASRSALAALWGGERALAAHTPLELPAAGWQTSFCGLPRGKAGRYQPQSARAAALEAPPRTERAARGRSDRGTGGAATPGLATQLRPASRAALNPTGDRWGRPAAAAEG